MHRHTSPFANLAAVLPLAAGLALAGVPTPAAAAEYCAPLPPQASIVDVHQYEDTDEAGRLRWSSTAIYALSTGQTAEAVLDYRSDHTGELSFAIDGEVVVIVRYTGIQPEAGNQPGAVPGIGRGFGSTSWVSPKLAANQAVAAELLQESVGTVLMRGLVPQARKCSELGKGVMEGLKYLWIGATAAAGAACCAGTGILGCGVCATGAAAAGFAGVEAADGHCD